MCVWRPGPGFESRTYLSPGLIHRRQFCSYVHTQEKHVQDHKTLTMKVHRSIIYDSRKATQVSIKYKALYPHSGLLLSHEKSTRPFNMDAQTLKALF